MYGFHRTIVITILFAAFPVGAGLGTTSGSDPGIWDKGGISLIAARIRKVTELADDRHATHVLDLEPIATLAGVFDATQKPRLEAKAWADRQTSAIDEIPPEGSLVLAVIYYDVSHGFMKITADR